MKPLAASTDANRTRTVSPTSILEKLRVER